MNLYYIVNEWSGKDSGEGPWTRKRDAQEFLDAEVGHPDYKIVSVQLPERYLKAMQFVRILAEDGTDAIWQPEWFALKDKARSILGS
jgi:hypothetical protein